MHWRTFWRRKQATTPAPPLRAILCHRGTDVVVHVSANIQTITIPVFADGTLIEYRYTRTDECLPVDDGLAVVFR